MATSVKEKITCHMTAILKALDCAICLSIIKSPVSMGCGHFFCRLCIVEVLKSNYRTPCPLCKRSFTRRGIENADQRNSIVLAAGKLALECGKFTGTNMVSPDTLNLFNNLDISPCSSTTSLNETKEEPKPSKSRKRKSQENVVCEKVSSSRSCVSNTEGKILVPDTFPANREVLQGSNKRQRQQQSGSQSSQSDDEFELPTLDEIIASVRISNRDDQQENNDELDDQEKKVSSGSNRKSLKVSFADTPAVSCKNVSASNRRMSMNAKESNNEEPEKNVNNKETASIQSKNMKTSKLRESIQNKKNALKNKTNQIISNGNENIVKNTPGNKKISIDSTKSLDDEKAKENINRKVTQNEDTNVTSSVAMSPKSSTKERSKMKPGKSRNNKALDEQEALISKLNAAGNFTLTVVNTRQKSNPASITAPEECYSLAETNLPDLSENAEDGPMDVVQLCRKEDQSLITDTAVSVQSVVSPTANKLETLSKSPGWSKVRQVGKDFRVKKFSKLQVEKNSNSCPMESDVSESSNRSSPCEMPKLIKISELEREAADNSSKNLECVAMNNKSNSKQSSQEKIQKSLRQQGCNSIKITAEIHSQELYNSFSKENESSDINENLSNYDETETSIVMNTMENTQSSPYDKSIFGNQNASNTTKTVSDESIVNFNGSCIPSPNMLSLKPNVTKVSNIATDIRHSSAEMEFQNDEEFAENVQTTMLDTYDSHMVENDMEIDENDEHILPVPENRVEPCMKQIIGKDSGLEMYNKQKFQKLPLNVSSREIESSKLSPKFRSVSKSVTTGTKALFAGDETVYFASHSQQTSQRLFEFCGDNTPKNNVTLAPAFGLYRHTLPSFGNESVQNQLAVFNRPSSTEKTKVLKRTCLTLEEIQDAFTKCSNERPVTICSLPFSSGEYRLDINVADETLNISVLKIDSFERPNETVERTSTIMFAEKNIQTSDSHPSPISVLPSSNAESECSVLDNNNATEPTKNLFPYLNQYFSDSEPSQQCNLLPEDNEDPLEKSEVIPFKPDHHCDPQEEPEETTRVVESMKTLLSELQALPTKEFSLSDVRIVTESVSVYDEVENDGEPSRQCKELAEGLPTEDLGPTDLQRTTDNLIVCETGGNIVRQTLKQSNELVISRVTKKADESLQYDDLPPTQEAFDNRDKLAAIKTKHNSSSNDICSEEESTNSFEKQTGVSPKNNSLSSKKLKGTESENQPESGKKNSSSLNQKLRTISPSFNSVNKSHLTLMEKYSTEETDPDVALVDKLVGPLKELAKELKASGKASDGTSSMGDERAGNQKRPLEIFEELVLSKNHESSGICLPSQRTSRLSLKSKGTPKKFKRIRRYSCSDDSDSDKEDVTEKIPSPKSSVLPSSSKENATSGSPTDHCTARSFASEDLTNGNTSDIAMEIESLDEKIKSVMTKLKDIGREDLLDSENGPDVSKLNDDLSLSDDNGAASDDSQKSTDIFSVPPTPPDVLSSDTKTLKTSRWKN